MAEFNHPLISNFKKIAEALGSNWKYTYHTSFLEHEDDLMDSQTVNFLLNGEDLLLSVHHSDPDTLWIYAGLVMISFGAVDHIHFLENEPKVVTDSFNGDLVSFIEITSDGKFNQYHNFPKQSYWPQLHSQD